jgi:chemotaxis protein CheX
LDGFEAALEGGQPVVGAVRDKLLEPLIEAARAALSEMAGVEPVVHAVYQKSMHHALGDIAAVIGLVSPAGEASLVVSFPHRTARALAQRILAHVTQDVGEDLIRDCVGEIANVVAGQAKALSAERPFRFGFCLPQTVVEAAKFQATASLDCLVVIFSCDQEEFALQLFVKHQLTTPPCPESSILAPELQAPKSTQ